MPKYFYNCNDAANGNLTLAGDTARHLLTVLRVKIGESIVLCDGHEKDCIGTVSEINKKENKIILSLGPPYICSTEPPVCITLYQAIPKTDKLEWVVQKGTELGVNTIQPIITKYTAAQAQNISNKIERYQRIAESAAGQSMRGIIPRILPPMPLPDAINTAPENRFHLAAYEKENHLTIRNALFNYRNNDARPDIKEIQSSSNIGIRPKLGIEMLHSPDIGIWYSPDIGIRSTKPDIGIWIGPEGGFAENEMALLQQRGAAPVTLGPRILRTETAGFTAIIHVLSFWEG